LPSINTGNMSGKTDSVWRKLIIWFRVLVKPQLREHKWIVILFFAGIAFIFGFYGFSQIRPEQSFLNWFYLTLQLFTLKSGDIPGSIPITLNIARFLAPALTFISIAVIVTNSFYNHLELFWLRVFRRDHVVICGLGYIGPVIVKQFCEKGLIVVAIEKDASCSEIEYCKRKGAIVIIGDAAEDRILKRAQIQKAKSLFAVTGDDEINAKILGQVKKIQSVRTYPLNCYIHIVDPKFANLLRAAQVPITGSQSINLEFVNIYQNASQCMFDCLPSLVSTLNSSLKIHVVIIGIGRMGESLLLYLVKRWKKQYGEKPPHRIKITIIDNKAAGIKKSLEFRYHALQDYCEIDAQNFELNSSDFYEFLDKTDTASINAIFICNANESMNFSTALYLNHKLKNNTIPIVIRTVRRKGFANFFEESCSQISDQFKNLHPFPFVDCGCCIKALMEGVNEVIAQALHNDYLDKRRREGADLSAKPGMKVWSKLDQFYKDQNRDQALNLSVNLKTKKYSIVSRYNWDEPLFKYKDDKEIEDLAILEHNRWWKFMREHGWRLGEEYDFEKKTSQDLVPWGELTDTVKKYDIDFINSYPSILAMVDLKIIATSELSSNNSCVNYDSWSCPQFNVNDV
jgi:hypothetical protein